MCWRHDDGSDPHFAVIYPKGDTHAEKHRSAANQVKTLLNGWIPASGRLPAITHFVEQRLGGFTGGQTSSQTLMALAAMNAVISYVLSGYGEVIHILPVTTKRIVGLELLDGEDKKQAVVRLAREAVPDFPYRETKKGNRAKGVDDMADAWLLTEAGLRLASGEASLGQPGKAKGGKRPPRGTRGGVKA